MDEPSLDLKTWIPQLIAVATGQPYDCMNSYALLHILPTCKSLHSLSLSLKRHGGVATFAKDDGTRCKPRLVLTLEEQR